LATFALGRGNPVVGTTPCCLGKRRVQHVRQSTAHQLPDKSAALSHARLRIPSYWANAGRPGEHKCPRCLPCNGSIVKADHKHQAVLPTHSSGGQGLGSQCSACACTGPQAMPDPHAAGPPGSRAGPKSLLTAFHAMLMARTWCAPAKPSLQYRDTRDTALPLPS